MTGNEPDADQLPIQVDGSETIVRAVVSPAHYKKSAVQSAAFRPPVGKTDLSVIRQVMGDDFCKNKGVEIGAASPNQTYVGLLTIKASAVRAAGSEVNDSRAVFLGHADLDHGLVSPPRDEPPTSLNLQAMAERCDALLKASTFHRDPERDQPNWKGSPLAIKGAE
jgi:hypothetical protein